MSKTKMTASAAARIQSASAKQGNGSVSKNSFASRAAKSVARNSK